MSTEDSQALKAAKLYSDDKTFDQIGEDLQVSKSHAQTLVRRGIILSIEETEDNVPPEPVLNNPGVHQDSGHPITPVELSSLPFPQDPRIGSYELLTTGIGRKVALTPRCLMIYDLWKGAGFQGDLSDFLEDSVNFMYASKRPAERS